MQEHAVFRDTPRASNPLSEATSPRSLSGRFLLLTRIANEEIAPVVVVSGQSGAGKSTVARILEESAIHPITRFMPRERRPDDITQDISWPRRFNKTGKDVSGPDSVFFSDFKFFGYYGFPKSDLIKQIKDNHGGVVIIGRAYELSPFIEGLRSLFPAVPVAAVRLDVPTEILMNRLGRRAGNPGELEQRTRELDEVRRQDLAQDEPLKLLYNLATVTNVSAEEADKLGLRESVSFGELTDRIEESVRDAKHVAALEARDILNVRSLERANDNISSAIIETLMQKVAPRFGTHAPVQAIIKSGLAATILLKDAGRTLSNDIDFAVVASENSYKTLHSDLESALGEKLPGFSWKSKGVYTTYGLNLVTRTTDGTDVELDAVPVNKVSPIGVPFEFDIIFDSVGLFGRRTAKLPDGTMIDIAPPTLTVLEKLLAARGPEQNKFDLYDSAGLMALYRLDFPLMRRMILQQSWGPNDRLASAVVDQLMRGHGVRDAGDIHMTNVQILESFGIRSSEIKNAAAKIDCTLEEAPEIGVDSEIRILTRDAIKQIAMLDCIYRATERIEGLLDTKWTRGNGRENSLRELFGDTPILNAANQLKTFCRYMVDFELGRQNIFVRRPGPGGDNRESFFGKLDSQRK